MSHKRMLCLLLAVLMIFTSSACGKKTEPTNAPTDGGQSGSQTQKPDDGGTNQNVTDAPKPGDAEKAFIPGTLYFYIRDAGSPDIVLQRLSLAGNRAGSGDFNAKEPDATGIRCIFELDEWVEFYPEVAAKKALQVFILKHDAMPDLLTALCSEDMAGCVQAFDLNPEEEGSWGSFYLNPEDCEPGYYDIVFAKEGKAEASLLTRFYAFGELEGKSDEELEKIMSDEIAAASGK